ncbi:hypothetical protein GCM10023238_03720 [Streptomyces heliomycini]
MKYAPAVDGSADPATGRFTLTFASGARAGAAFLVTSGNRADGPWTYTTEAGKEISDTWNSAYSEGSYDPDRARPERVPPRLPGADGVAGCEVTARHTGDDVRLTFVNEGSGTGPAAAGRRLPRPSHDRHRPARRHRAPHRRPAREPPLVRPDGHLPAEPAYLRRFAGHVENGRPGVSDPAIVTD